MSQARKQLEAAVAEISNVSEGEMAVPPRHHRHFVARRGEVLRRIADDCGGVQISFPRQGVNSDRVVLKGPKDCIEAAKVRINEIIEDLEAKVNNYLSSPPNTLQVMAMDFKPLLSKKFLMARIHFDKHNFGYNVKESRPLDSNGQ